MLVTKSFGSKIPKVLMKGKSFLDPKMLAAMPSFEEFDGNLPQTGFRYTFLERITEYSMQANSVVLDTFSAGGASF